MLYPISGLRTGSSGLHRLRCKAPDSLAKVGFAQLGIAQRGFDPFVPEERLNGAE
jgi:hypothetical protein